MRGIRARLGRAGLVLLAGTLLSSLASCGGVPRHASGPAPLSTAASRYPSGPSPRPVSYDGRDYAYGGPQAAGAGQMQIRLANRSAAPFDGFSLVIGKLAAGRTLSDVQAVIRANAAPNAPPWFQVTATLPAASGANPAWGVALTPGRYALV